MELNLQKKTWLLLILLVAIFNFNQAQSIPNGGFENWTIRSCENPQFYTSSNNSLEKTTAAYVNAEKVSDAFHGQYALKLTSKVVNGDSIMAYYINGNPSGGGASGGIPYTQKPTGFRVHYKSNINLGDSAIMLFIFKKNGATIGQYLFKIGDNQSSYTLLQKSFSPALSVTPDTVVIGAASSDAFVDNFTTGNQIQLDSLSFTGVSNQPLKMNGDYENWVTSSDTILNTWYTRQSNLRTLDKYTGTYALELQSGPKGFGDNQNVMGYASTGVPNKQGISGGLPYSQSSDTLFFHYKYIPADVNDSAIVNVMFMKNGAQFSGMQLKLGFAGIYTKAKLGYTLFQAPDTMIISLQSSKTWPPTNSQVGSDFKIDQLYLKSQSTPVADFILPSSACVGKPINITDNSTNLVSTWNWVMGGASPSSSTAQNVSLTYSSSGTKSITLYVTNEFGVSNFVTKQLVVNSNPTVHASIDTICPGSQAMLVAIGASTYVWNNLTPGDTFYVSPTSSTVYNVTGTLNGCSSNAIGGVVVDQPQNPNICFVTVDTLNNSTEYNKIVWQKPVVSNIDSFVVYKESIVANQYIRLGAQAYSAVSEYLDLSSQPNTQADRYKLSVIDTCGNESVLANSIVHRTILLQSSQSTQMNVVNLSWNSYEGLSVGTINIYRGTSRNNMALVGSTAGSNNNYKDNTAPVSGNLYYGVDFTLPSQCVSTLRTNPSMNFQAKTYTKTKSNTDQNLRIVNGVNGLQSSTGYALYPNPTADDLNITLAFAPDNAKIELMDLLGNVVLSQDLEQTRTIINIQNISKGVYLVKLSNGNNIFTTKLIKY